MKIKTHKGFSVLEYVMLIIIILTALIILKDYIERGFIGRWKMTGDSFGVGRQYDPSRTLDCAYDYGTNAWYDQGCFDQARLRCSAANPNCEAQIMNVQCRLDACRD